MSRAALSRERVIDAALALVDKEGIESLSMRRLGQQLGVEAMSLYNHVAGKADILDGLAESVLAHLDVDLDPAASWQDKIRRIARSFRTAATKHPGAFTLVSARQLGSAAGLRPVEAELSILKEAGFDAETSVHILRTFVAFVTGSLVRELTAEPEVAGTDPVARATRIEVLKAAGFSAIADAADHIAIVDHEAEYYFGVDLFIAALEARLRRGRDLDVSSGFSA